MHDSVMMFGQAQLNSVAVRGKRVIEVGSMDVNGSLKGHVLSLLPTSYVGVDFMPGLGVDIVCDASDVADRFGAEAFDVVISTEMLEHVQDWRSAITSMKKVLAPRGILLLTARGPGMFWHGHPFDWHRFTVEDFAKIFADFEIEVLEADTQHPGVLLRAQKPEKWQAAALNVIHVAPADEKNAPR